jgi:hypothetical protein
MTQMMNRLSPRVGVLAGLRRFLFGDQVKRAHISDHGAFMRSLGCAWAIPMTLVFSSGALITLGQSQIAALVSPTNCATRSWESEIPSEE